MSKKLMISFFMIPVLILGLSVASFAANTPSLSLTIIEGVLSVDIVDGSDISVSSPGVTMTQATSGFAIQSSTGTLGTASQKIRLANPTSTPAWTVTIAATSGIGAAWTATGATMDFNAAASSTGTLTIDPSVSTIVGVLGGNTTGVSKGSLSAFAQGVTDSITLYSADVTAADFEQYDLTGVSLSQEIPVGQTAGDYTLNFTLTSA